MSDDWDPDMTCEQHYELYESETGFTESKMTSFTSCRASVSARNLAGHALVRVTAPDFDKTDLTTSNYFWLPYATGLAPMHYSAMYDAPPGLCLAILEESSDWYEQWQLLDTYDGEGRLPITTAAILGAGASLIHLLLHAHHDGMHATTFHDVANAMEEAQRRE